jgi:hypothetical protein
VLTDNPVEGGGALNCVGVICIALVPGGAYVFGGGANVVGGANCWFGMAVLGCATYAPAKADAILLVAETDAQLSPGRK